MKSYIYILLLPLLFLSSCQFATQVTPSKEISEYNIEVDDISAIHASGFYDLKIIQGSKESVKMTVNSNLVEYLKIEQIGNTIHFGMDNLSTSGATILATITVINLNEIDLSGIVKAEAKSLEFDNLAVEMSGVSDLKVKNCKGYSLSMDLSGVSKASVKGQIKNLEGEFSGSSSLQAKELKVLKSADIDASGTSAITVTAQNELIADLSGTSTVNCHGHPQKVTKDLSGLAKVEMR